MRRSILLLTLVGAMLLACTGVVLAQTTTSDSPGATEGLADGEILVKFKDNTPQTEKQEVHEEQGGKVEKTIHGINVQVVDVPKGEEKSKAKKYKDDPNVEFAEVNGVYEAVANTPDDPKAAQQWQYNNTKYSTTNKGDIDAYEAWNGGSTTAWDGGTTGSNAVNIAILDTGIKENHEDLTGKVVKSRNFTSSDPNAFADGQGHGTHVAGSAAAVTNNGKGVAGTCPGCSLYNVKVLDDTGSGYYSWIANGITWAADNGANVINMSLGGTSGSSTLKTAIDYAWSRGVVIVAAAGNSNTNSLFYPAAYNNVIAVGATDSNDAKASFSNYGSSWVDVAAPGVNILSTTKDGGYQAWNGTSMATPHVAGEAGLIWSKSLLCTAGDNTCVRNQIESKADPISGTGTYWAKGRINANGGVGGSTTAAPPSDTTPPETTIDPNSGPSGTVNSNSASFDFSSSETDSTFECKLDGDAWEQNCASPKDYTNLADGSHTFQVRATDSAGNTDQSPASRTWTIDTKPPTVSSKSPAQGKTGVSPGTNVMVTFSKNIDQATLTDPTKDPVNPTLTLVESDANGITGTRIENAPVSYDARRKRATLNPYSSSTTKLSKCTWYKAIVTTGVKDRVGNPLAANVEWWFKTKC